MSTSLLAGIVSLALLQGLLIVLPRRNALGWLRPLRSPAWAAVPTLALLVGTFAPLEIPGAASALILLAVVGAPLMLVVAVLSVVRGPRVPIAIATAALVVTALMTAGLAGQLSATVLTALACLTVGVALVRLTPRGWLLGGVFVMCVADVILLAAGVGATASAALNAATHHFHGPALDHATVGSVSIGYPDLVLAGMLGGSLAAESAVQRRTGLLLVTLVAAYGLLLPLAGILPATVPIALAFVLARRKRRGQSAAPSSARWRARVASSRNDASKLLRAS
ncbi:MAG TPA: hypothetical protein VFH80_19390 [Solirubrobacteraceae bacterium]|nr:hypothetical protein [Solirubrobacteraceae bacterium]